MERFLVPILFVVISLSVVAGGYLLAKRRPRPEQARRTLLWTGWIVLLPTASFMALIAIGELMADVGAGAGWGMTMPWILMIATLAVLSLTSPRIAVYLTAAFGTVPIGIATWEAFAPVAHRAWMDEAGPIVLILTYVLVGAASLAALRRPAEAGWTIVAIAGIPMSLQAVTPAGELASSLIIASLSFPAFAAGVAFLLAARKQGPDGGHKPSEPTRAPGRAAEREAQSQPDRSASAPHAG